MAKEECGMISLSAAGGGALPADLGSRVVVGLCDIAGAGCRAAMALGAADGMEAKVHDLAVVGSSASPIAWGTGPAPPPVTLTTLSRGGVAVCSVVAVSAAWAADEEAPLAHALVRLAAGREVLLLAAVRFPQKVAEGEGVRAVGLNGARPPPGYPAFPDSAPIQDSLVASLLHHALAARLPTVCLLAPGHRVALGQGGDGGGGAVRALGGAAAAVAGVAFDAAKAGGLVPQSLWYRGEGDESDMVYR